MAAFCLYDMKVVTWKQVREKLAELGVMASTSRGDVGLPILGRFAM